jgi:hypothetical protein
MKKTIMKIVVVILFGLLFLSFLFIDYRICLQSYETIIMLGRNIAFVTDVVSRLIPLALVLILFFIIYKLSNAVIKIERFSIGGFNIIFEKPEELFMQQMKNFLNTKRSLFMFRPETDNIYDCIASYYNTYIFIREHMTLYDTKYSQSSLAYKIANEIVFELNEFLTSFQSDYRRWYEYRVQNLQSKDANKRISEIQKEYWNYNDLISGFEKFNVNFCKYAATFDVETERWHTR